MDGNKFRDNGAAGETRPERVHKRSNKCIKPNYSGISKKEIIMTVHITVPIIASVPEILRIKCATNVCACGGEGRQYVV